MASFLVSLTCTAEYNGAFNSQYTQLQNPGLMNFYESLLAFVNRPAPCTIELQNVQGSDTREDDSSNVVRLRSLPGKQKY